MPVLYRKAKAKIESWFKESRNALLVTGARQVGKTWLIREFLMESGHDYIEINLIENPELIPVLERAVSVEDLIISISTAKSHTLQKNNTVIFIDEVQELSDVVTRIKFWVDEGSFRYILSGSLLGVELKALRSAPVGYLSELKMFPMDFEEFLLASGVPSDTYTYLVSCFLDRKPVTDIVHNTILKHFKRYLVVGGMPQAVQEYVDSSDINKVTLIQQSIIETYKLDFTRYEKKEKRLKLQAIYDQIPSQLMKQNRRFNYSDIKKGLRFERLEDSFLWLTSAGVSIPVYNTSEPRVALKQNTQSTLLKLYSSDVGLLTCQYGSAIRMRIIGDDEKINLGGIYENAVAQELNTMGSSLYFYNSHKNGELDFLIEDMMSVIPIEVKSGKDYTIHSALNKAVSNEEYEIDRAYVLCNDNIRTNDRITYIPVYMASFIKSPDEPLVLERI